jgi:hypothetical protein
MVRKGKERAGFLTKKGNVSVGKIYHTSCRAAKNRLTEAVAAHEKSAAAAHGFSNVPICFTR